MKKTVLIMAMSVLGITSQGQTKTTKDSKTVVLVHGAWADASCWDGMVPHLNAKGDELITVNLAGHGKDTTSVADISFETYVNQVKAAVGDRKNVILVGHSFAGLVISQVAEEIPSQISKMIFIAAALPHDGDSLLGLAKKDPGSQVGKFLTIDQTLGIAIVSKDAVANVFAADAPSQVQKYLAEHIQPEPLAPLATSVHLTEKNFGSVRKVYIHTVHDNTISYPAQKYMVNTGNVAKVYTLESSHSPFISSAGKLADIINSESK